MFPTPITHRINLWLCIGLGLTMVAAVCLGAVDYAPWRLLEALGSLPILGPTDQNSANNTDAGAILLLIGQLRAPRVVLAAVAGAALAISGVTMQSLFRNPMAEPGLAGVSGGASLGVALALVALPSIPLPSLGLLSQGLNTGALGIAALLGGLLAAQVVVRCARQDHQTDTRELLLAGIAVNAIAGAAIAWLCLNADHRVLRNYLGWVYGDLGRTDWTSLLTALPLFGVAAALPWRDARQLDALLLGESAASHLGVQVEPLKRRLLLLAVLGAATTAATAGPVGFIGLMAPHLARRSGAHLHRQLLPRAGLCGAWLLVMADLVGRRGSPPGEIPAGILTALLGGPFFLALLLASRRERSAP